MVPGWEVPIAGSYWLSIDVYQITPTGFQTVSVGQAFGSGRAGAGVASAPRSLTRLLWARTAVSESWTAARGTGPRRLARQAAFQEASVPHRLLMTGLGV